MIGKLFKSLFGNGSADGAESEPAPDATLEYQGFAIEAAPIAEGGQFRTAGFISGEHDGEHKRVQFIRADTSGDKTAAIEHSLAKGKQIVDEQGAALLQREFL